MFCWKQRSGSFTLLIDGYESFSPTSFFRRSVTLCGELHRISLFFLLPSLVTLSSELHRSFIKLYSCSRHDRSDRSEGPILCPALTVAMYIYFDQLKLSG